MIIVQLKGGLGNQLFQYAAGLSLAKHHQVQLKVDVRELQQPDEQIGTCRNYELQHLIIPPVIAGNQEIENLTRKSLFLKYYQKTLPSYKRLIYNEKQFSFDTNFFKGGSNIYLKGYRQSEKYFLSIEKDIRKAFQLKTSLTARIKNWSDKFKEVNSVSIHIRRGDYTTSSVQKYHGSVPALYYQQAIEKISSIIGNPSFFIFSDDITWVKNNLKFQEQAEFISSTVSKNHYEDFYLMSSCKHNIIANSTFSWWAAWLNPNPDKIVIAPKKWYNMANIDTRDLIPDSWIRI